MHINNKRGCKKCNGYVSWTLELFLFVAYEIHGEMFDYSQVTADHIKTTNSNIPVKCNKCNYKWTLPIYSHINNKHGCPDCAGIVPWNLVRFLAHTQEIHGKLFEYSKVTEKHIKNSRSRIPIKCNTCNYEWDVMLSYHVNSRSGCRNCNKRIPWTLNKLYICGQEIHGNLYDYSQVTSEHIKSIFSNIPIICTKCNSKWEPTIDSHINHKRGCRLCKRSHGEIACQCVLNNFNISYDIEYTLPLLPRKRFDFKFTYQDKNYIIEYDGIQHFNQVALFHEDEKEFKENKIIMLLNLFTL